MKEIVFLSHRIPYPPNKGDKVRSYHLLKFFAERYRVHLGTFIDSEEDWQYVDEVKKLCGRTYFARLNPLRARLKSLRGFLLNQPLTLLYYRHAGLQAWVDDLLNRAPVGEAVTFSSSMAQYLWSSLRLNRIADFVDVDSDKWRQYAESTPWPLSAVYRREAKKLLHFEKKVVQKFDATVFVTEQEADLFRSLAPELASKVRSISNGVDTSYFSPDRRYANPYKPQDRILLFTGAMDYRPNIDATVWFAHEVFPTLKTSFPDLKFFIVGARPDLRVVKLIEIPGVVVTGAVPDMRPYLQHAGVVVAPLRIARGIQNKILEAMAMEKTVVASAQASRPLNAANQKELVVADTPTDFSSSVSQLLTGDCARTIGKSARRWVVANYSWERNLKRFEVLLEQKQGSRGQDLTLAEVRPARIIV